MARDLSESQFRPGADGYSGGDDDRRYHGQPGPDVDDVIRLKTAAARPKDLDALPGLLRNPRGRAGHHETR